MANVFISGTGSYVPPKVVPNSIFFEDGTRALALSETEEDKGFIDFNLHSDGRDKEHFTIPGGGSENPTSEKTTKQ